MNGHLSRHTVTFIVRFWIEYLDQTPPTWRGEIERVDHQAVMYFGDFAEMVAQIQHCIQLEHSNGGRKQNE